MAGCCPQVGGVLMTFKRKTPEEIAEPFGGIKSIRSAQVLATYYNVITHNEQLILTLRLEGWSTVEIAKEFAISRQRVHQIEKAVIAKLIEYTKE